MQYKLFSTNPEFLPKKPEINLNQQEEKIDIVNEHCLDIVELPSSLLEVNGLACLKDSLGLSDPMTSDELLRKGGKGNILNSYGESSELLNKMSSITLYQQLLRIDKEAVEGYIIAQQEAHHDLGEEQEECTTISRSSTCTTQIDGEDVDIDIVGIDESYYCADDDDYDDNKEIDDEDTERTNNKKVFEEDRLLAKHSQQLQMEMFKHATNAQGYIIWLSAIPTKQKTQDSSERIVYHMKPAKFSPDALSKETNLDDDNNEDDEALQQSSSSSSANEKNGTFAIKKLKSGIKAQKEASAYIFNNLGKIFTESESDKCSFDSWELTQKEIEYYQKRRTTESILEMLREEYALAEEWQPLPLSVMSEDALQRIEENRQKAIEQAEKMNKVCQSLLVKLGQDTNEDTEFLTRENLKIPNPIKEATLQRKQNSDSSGKKPNDTKKKPPVTSNKQKKTLTVSNDAQSNEQQQLGKNMQCFYPGCSDTWHGPCSDGHCTNVKHFDNTIAPPIFCVTHYLPDQHEGFSNKKSTSGGKFKSINFLFL